MRRRFVWSTDSPQFWVWYFLAAMAWLGAWLKIAPNNYWFWLGSLCFGFLGLVFWSPKKSKTSSTFSFWVNHNWLVGIMSFGVLVFLLAGLVADWKISEPQPIFDSTDFSGEVLLISDPRPAGLGVSFRGRLKLAEDFADISKTRHITVDVIGYGGERFLLEDRLVGEKVYITGRLRPPNKTNYGSSFKIQARLSVSKVGEHKAGKLHYQVANGIRRTIDEGASSLSPKNKALFTGIVYGDDRNQSLAHKDLFRSTGLTHILAVSGQNIAFVLAIFYPLIKRMSSSLQLLVTILVLGTFFTITRFEPSVLRAGTMAIFALLVFRFKPIYMSESKPILSKPAPSQTALLQTTLPQTALSNTTLESSDTHQSADSGTIDNDATDYQHPPKLFDILWASLNSKAGLGVAVLALIFITPEIVGKIAFQLSVLATAGIVFLSPHILARLRGPSWFRLSFALTLGAQLAVAPLLISAFGGVAVAALPANILALPVVGLISVWGMTAGMVAGITGGWMATAIHFPNQLFLIWIDTVAGWSAGLNLGWLGHVHIWILFACLGLSFLFRQKLSRMALLGLSIFVLVLPALMGHIDTTDPKILQAGSASSYWSGESLLILDRNITNGEVLTFLSRQNVSTLRLVVFLENPRYGMLDSLKTRYGVVEAWTPTEKYQANTVQPEVGSVYVLGDLFLIVLENQSGIQIQVCKSGEVQGSPTQPATISGIQDIQTNTKVSASKIAWNCGFIFGAEAV